MVQNTVAAIWLLIVFTSIGRAQADQLCFAYLLKGDVVIECEGRTTQITHRGDIESFAISDDQLSFAYTTSRTVQLSQTVGSSEYRTAVIDLRSGAKKVARGVRRIVSTCGILLPIVPNGNGRRTRDLLRGEQIHVPMYTRFRCSADRKTIAGTLHQAGGGLYRGVPPEKIADAESFSVLDFNISPNGSHVVYFKSNGPLCVFSSAGPARCVAVRGTITGNPSVNDVGEVLVAIGTSKECFYRTSYDFSPTRFPGATDENRDECLGIGYWRPSAEFIQLRKPLGMNPQWISPSTAKFVYTWSSNSGAKGGQKGGSQVE